MPSLHPPRSLFAHDGVDPVWLRSVMTRARAFCVEVLTRHCFRSLWRRGCSFRVRLLQLVVLLLLCAL